MRSLFLVVLALCLTLAACRASLENVGIESAIPDEYVVVFHPNSSVQIRDKHVEGLLKRFIRKDFEKIIAKFDIGTLIGYAAVLTPETLAVELEHPNVARIEANIMMYALDDTVTQPGATWGIDRVDQASLPLTGQYSYYASAGQGVTAYVIDTGIHISHTEFEGRASWGANFVTGEGETDGNGHGTHVAGTIGGRIYGLAKKVTLVAVKVLSAGGSGTLAGVVQGIDWVTKNHVDRGRDARSVVNLSLGGSATTTLDDAVENSVAAGVIHAIAAGNSNANACSYSPARAPSAITVGATTNTDARASFSNIGNCLDIFAPGNAITSSWIGSNTATNTISGTSMAAPHVAGAVALHLGHLLSEGELVPPPAADVDSYIKESATKGIVTSPGTGSPNNFLFSPHIDF